MLSVRPHFSKSSKTKQSEKKIATGETEGLAEWIIDDTCLVIDVIWEDIIIPISESVQNVFKI